MAAMNGRNRLSVLAIRACGCASRPSFSLPLLHLAYGVRLRQKNGKHIQQLSCIAGRVEVPVVFVWLRHCAFRLLLFPRVACLAEEKTHLGGHRRTRAMRPAVCSERRVAFYLSLADAISAGEVNRGWIPDFA